MTLVASRVRVGIKFGGVAVVGLGVWFLAAGLLRAARPVPPVESAVSALQQYADASSAKPEEVNPGTLLAVTNQVVERGGQTYLLEIAVGTSYLNEKRVVFTVYEVDPDVTEWRPLSSVDGPPAALGPTTAVLELPDSSRYQGSLTGGEGIFTELPSQVTEEGEIP